MVMTATVFSGERSGDRVLLEVIDCFALGRAMLAHHTASSALRDPELTPQVLHREPVILRVVEAPGGLNRRHLSN